MQNFLILRELQTEFLKFKIHFAKISYKEFLIKKTECIQYKLSLVISTFDYISKFMKYYKIKIRETYNYQSTRIQNGIKHGMTQKSSRITQEISVVASERPRHM